MIRLSERFRISVVTPAILVGFICGFAMSYAQQSRKQRGPDPQTQLLNNYRRYPDRYILISNEAWKYDDMTHTAVHSFTLKNNAGVAYSGIEIRLNYMNASGKTLQNQTLKIPGTIAVYGTRKIKGLKATNVPSECDQVTVIVAKAVIYP